MSMFVAAVVYRFDGEKQHFLIYYICFIVYAYAIYQIMQKIHARASASMRTTR